MQKVTYEKPNSNSLWLLAPFGCLTSPFTHASAYISTQSIRLSSTKDIQEIKVSNVEGSTQSADLDTQRSIRIRTGQCSDPNGALSLLSPIRIDNTLSPSNQQGDIKVVELCCALPT